MRLLSRVGSFAGASGTAAHRSLSTVSVSGRPAASAHAPVSRGSITLRAGYSSSFLSLHAPLRKRVSALWHSDEHRNDAASELRLRSCFSVGIFARAAVCRLLLAFIGLATTTAGAGRPPRPLVARYFSNSSMRRLNSLSHTFPLKAPAARGGTGGGAAAEDDVVHVPRLLYGTAWKKERTENLVYDALRQGFRGVDTGMWHFCAAADSRWMYLATRIHHQSVKHARTSLQGATVLNVRRECNRRCFVVGRMQTSLHNLQCDYLDAVLLHSPLPTMEQTMEAWRVLETAVDKKKIRLIGISNTYDVSTLQALYQSARVKPSLLQNRFYSDTGYDVEVRFFCKEHGITYEAFWTLTANPHILRSRAVEGAAARAHCTPEQVWFRYLLEKGFIVLTGTKSIHHMQDDLQSLSIDFSQEDRAAIDEVVAASS